MRDWAEALGFAQALFGRATAFDASFLEYDDARSGSFEPLAAAPEDKQVVLGLVSIKTPALGTPQELGARIDEAARVVDRDRLGLSTQCGFASMAAGTPITEADEESKLRPLADTAHAAEGLSAGRRSGVSPGRLFRFKGSFRFRSGISCHPRGHDDNLPDARAAGRTRRMPAPRGCGPVLR